MGVNNLGLMLGCPHLMGKKDIMATNREMRKAIDEAWITLADSVKLKDVQDKSVGIAYITAVANLVQADLALTEAGPF